MYIYRHPYSPTSNEYTLPSLGVSPCKLYAVTVQSPTIAVSQGPLYTRPLPPTSSPFPTIDESSQLSQRLNDRYEDIIETPDLSPINMSVSPFHENVSMPCDDNVLYTSLTNINKKGSELS